ncbi:MAG TPA: ATPase, T2SS/T4P/T4SS family, partial [Acidobacteriota bacterium]|nr:ATPase, T2SS/T4P/T4SS family [Acidobacteriota bacterium]
NDRHLLHKLFRQGSADLSYSIPGKTRFRVNVFSQRGTYSIVLRVIPSGVPTVEELGLPKAINKIAEERNGIVLVTGPTGNGKSTTLAAIINRINEDKAYHIVTIEDPLEYLHRHKKSTINQRELGADVPSFALALRAALRQAPKVILVGEMRDLETTEIALEAAETGHLVMSTLHTIDASKTVDRIVGIFPKNEEQQIRTRFSQTFKWIVCQRTREYIQKGESEKEGRSLLDAIIDGSLDGMQSFDDELERLWKEGVITKETALSYATNAPNLSLRMSGIDATSSAGKIYQESQAKKPEEPPRPGAGPAQPSKSQGVQPAAQTQYSPATDIKDLME